MRKIFVIAGTILLTTILPTHAQTSQNTAPPETQLFHPAGPLPSYEVATIKPMAPGTDSGFRFPPGRGPGGSQTIKNYILNAYGGSGLFPAQLIGGPEWISKELYVIQAKAPDELRDAMKKMTQEEQRNENHLLQQSLLAERFKLKVHFETREMPYFELVVANGGLKVKDVAPPPPSVPGTPLPPPSANKTRPGVTTFRAENGATVINAGAITMRQMIAMLRQMPEVGGKPVVDKTGFMGNFDVVNIQWAGVIGLGNGGAAPSEGSTAPSMFTAIEEQLGVKLVPAKGPVEVIVIDSIERPSEN